ncbi:ImmA/IrrE family metallo-endopeptidase [Pseudothauera nasutitermitis]|uniref:ImmA/IrrE family metallo-endopeptidase n=1 Tax=Pseudothauera nasutitermitis TaxID=2565930 RepID=A0A4S4AZ72_9RHOO|nr:short-chain fatty acyl-CoA regulator family protein [Pseudothauera nasutitermitis]THF65443.1 ImmA/IrrE family metallo-endopeptidase [Pseudothauera nasutitermitis]
MSRKLFIGARLRRLREQGGQSQAALAGRLGISLSYVCQLENNQRPVSAPLLLKLVQVFQCDIAEFSEEQDKRLLHELQAVCLDRGVVGERIAPAQLARMVEHVPDIAAAFVSLAERHQRLREEYAQVIERFRGEPAGVSPTPLPHEEVRDFFNRRDNHIDTLDTQAEALAQALALRPGERAAALREVLRQRHGVDTLASDFDDFGVLRRFDARRRRLEIAAGLSDAQQAFQLATQLALLEQLERIDGEIAAAGLADAHSRGLARQGLAHYFAGALLLPYGEFLHAARAARYDIEALQRRFAVGFETVCHRLSTLQRSGARGVPFYLVRVDRAGNISKRQSATAFHFAHHGGACPLWHVHDAFAHPGQILVQTAEMPDGTRFFGIARSIGRGGGGWRTPRKSFAIGLGCELPHARELVYADGLDLAAPREVVPIGPGCRVCPRADCVQRAFPPAGKPLETSVDAEFLGAYRFGDEHGMHG